MAKKSIVAYKIINNQIWKIKKLSAKEYVKDSYPTLADAEYNLTLKLITRKKLLQTQIKNIDRILKNKFEVIDNLNSRR